MRTLLFSISPITSCFEHSPRQQVHFHGPADSDEDLPIIVNTGTVRFRTTPSQYRTAPLNIEGIRGDRVDFVPYDVQGVSYPNHFPGTFQRFIRIEETKEKLRMSHRTIFFALAA